MKSPIKWLGGKSKLVPEIEEIMSKYKFKRYIDLFAGSLAIPISLKLKKCILNDINPYLINLYNVIKNNVKVLCDKLKILNDNKFNNGEEFQKIKNEFNILKFKKDLNLDKKIRLASIFIYLNKRSFNGLYRENKSGIYNVPYRKNNSNIYDEENIIELSKYLNENKIELLNNNFDYFDISKFKKGDLVYLDPPYYPSKKSKFTSYSKDGFGVNEQIKLCELCKELDKKGIKFIMSNSPCNEIEELYKDFNKKKIYLGRQMRSGQGKSDVYENKNEYNEILIYN